MDRDNVSPQSQNQQLQRPRTSPRSLQILSPSTRSSTLFGLLSELMMSLHIRQQIFNPAQSFTLWSKGACIQPKPQLLHVGALRDLSTSSARTNLWRLACSPIPHRNSSFNSLHHISGGRYLPHDIRPATARTFSLVTTRSARYQPPNPWSSPPLPESESPNVTSPRVASLVTKGLIAFCTAITLARFYADTLLDPHTKVNASRSTTEWCMRIRDISQKYFIASTENYRSHRSESVLGSTFMHGSLLHIAVNMFVLNSFAPMVIMHYGLLRAFIPLWFLAGSAGGVAFVRWQQVNEPRSVWDNKDIKSESFLGIKPTPETRAICSHQGGGCGASGVLSGILGFLFTAGHRGMTVGIPFVPLGIPLSVATLGYAAFEYWALSTGSLPQLGHAGHLGGVIGGAMFGVIFRLPFLRKRRLF